MDKLLMLLLLAIFIAIIAIDLQKMVIPNILTLGVLLCGIVGRGCDFWEIENGVLGMGSYTLPYLLIYGYVSDILNRDALGFGDIKLMLGLGYILGYDGLLQVYIFFIATFTLASFTGIIVALYKRTLKFRLPFSPFLILVFMYFQYYT